jgi:hypothetical protein
VAKYWVGGPSGKTVSARFKRDSDGWFWNNSTEAWQAGSVDVSLAWDSDMEYYWVDISHADFIADSSTVRYFDSGGTTWGHSSSAEGGDTITITYGVSEVETGVT